MKKRIYLLCILFCLSSVALFADEDCDIAINEAKSKYNSGNYSDAKKLFDYVVNECGPNYGNASSWSNKCSEMLTPQLTVSRTAVNVGASSGTTSITVTSNREWVLQNTSSNMFSVSKDAKTVKINYYANSSSSSRSGYFDVVTVDGSKSVRVRVNQAAASNHSQKSSSSSQSTSNTSSSKSSSVATTLSVSKTRINATAAGTTEYITVTSNISWEIQYPSAAMYTAEKSGNKVIVKIRENSSSDTRTDWFYIKTTDGKQSVKISLSQSGRTSSSSSSYRSYSYSSSPYRRYINNLGVFEITWYSMRAGIGSGVAYSSSLFKLRWGPLQLSPLEFACGYDFLSDDGILNYQPTIDAFIPFSSEDAIYIGVGPTYDVFNDYLWFKVEAGWHYHWGSSASSDFFLRYDGSFCVGVSIQWSTGW